MTVGRAALLLAVTLTASSSIAQINDNAAITTGGIGVGGIGVGGGGVGGGFGGVGGGRGGLQAGPGLGPFNNLQLNPALRPDQLQSLQNLTAAGSQGRALIIPSPPAIVNGLVGTGASATLPPIVNGLVGTGASVPLPPGSLPLERQMMSPTPPTNAMVGAPVQIFIQAPASSSTASSAPTAATASPLIAAPQSVAPSDQASDDVVAIQPSPAIAPSALATVGVSTLSFNDLDSGLRDCDIPFAELEDKSPFCRGIKPGQQCIRFSYNQFPEIVRLSVAKVGRPAEVCTGTLIAPNWILTAAHCFINGPTNSYVANGQDLVINPSSTSEHVHGAVAEALNAKMLDYNSRARRISQVFVHGKFEGYPTYANDLAVARIASAYPAAAVSPAELAKEDQFSELTTQAGYGFSNYGGGTLGEFNLTWVRVTRKPGLLSFNPQDNKLKTGFCQGDSGGPVLAGSYRGCKPADVSPERRPRLLQGVISYNFLGKGTGDTEEMKAAQACIASESMVMQDVTLADRRRWICRATGGTALGCR